MAKCPLQKHNVTKVADLVKISARLRHPLQHPTHQTNHECIRQDCARERTQGCMNPQPEGCAMEVLTRLNLIPPKYNPTKQDLPDGMSLTRSRKLRNQIARQNNGEITFDPSMTCKESLAKCFRIFTDPNRTSNHMAKRYRQPGPILRCRELTIYTNGACINNGKLNTQCGGGVWFDQNNPRNLAIRIPGESQSNQVGELAAVIAAINATAPYQHVKIITDSKYVIEGLTMHLESWENDGWIEIKTAPLFKKAAHLMRHRSAKTTFQWTKCHNGSGGNEGSDRLAKRGANKQEPDTLNLDVPVGFDIQGEKLSTLTQAKAYRGILERKEIEPRNTLENNLQLTREAISQVSGDSETSATIWHSLRRPIIKPIIQQFLYKTIHNTHKIGTYWSHLRTRREGDMRNMRCNGINGTLTDTVQRREYAADMAPRAKPMAPPQYSMA